MKRFLAVGALLVAMASAVFVARADAILFGSPDGNAHSGVGYIVFYDASKTPLWRCTGSLVSTRVVLTAGHCAGTFGPDAAHLKTPVLAQVWFDKEIQRSKDYPAGDTAVPCAGFKGFPCTGGDSYGAPVAHPLFHGSDADGVFYDIGVVVLTKKQKDRDVLDLAPTGTLDGTAANASMTIVGFGTQSLAPPPVDFRQRMQGTVTFLRAEGLPSPANPDDDPSFADFTNRRPGVAACHGDSGGPVINRNGDIVAVLSLIDPTVDGWCEGDGYHYRTDTADSKRFLALFGVGVPSGRDQGGNHQGGDQQHGKHGTSGLRDS